MKSRIASPTAGSNYPSQNNTSNTLETSWRALQPPLSTPNGPPLQKIDYNFGELEWRRSNSTSSIASSTSQRLSYTGKGMPLYMPDDELLPYKPDESPKFMHNDSQNILHIRGRCQVMFHYYEFASSF
jgi:hypothetical protein